MNVADRYPEATIWLTGHSLGGALASLVGQTFLVPTVTFEIPGDSLASRRLHLPHPPGVHLPLWHFGHTADPIFVGVCTVWSLYSTSQEDGETKRETVSFCSKGASEQLLVWWFRDGNAMSHWQGKF